MASSILYKVTLPNLALFQGVWWSCILQQEVLASLLLVIMATHFWLTRDNNLQRDARVLVVMSVGFMTDWMMLQMGWYQQTSGGFPLWLAMLWIGFALTLPRSMISLLKRRAIWLMLCAVFGPLAYFAGALYDRIQIAEWAIIPMVMQWIFLGYFMLFLFTDKTMGPKQIADGVSPAVNGQQNTDHLVLLEEGVRSAVRGDGK